MNKLDKKFKEEKANARRHFLTGELVIEDLSPSSKKILINKRKKVKKVREIVRSTIFDKRLYYNKWYPWCYKGETPTVYPQGFYDLNYHKKKLLLTYGPDALKYIKWIKGKEAIERGFSIGKTLYINGRWQNHIGRIYYPPEIQFNKNHKSLRLKLFTAASKGSSRVREKSIIKLLKPYMNGRIILKKPNSKFKSNNKPSLY